MRVPGDAGPAPAVGGGPDPAPVPRNDEEPLVELVDVHGRAIGSAPKLAAHAAPGQLHRAVSVFLLDADGRLVVQRRAPGKYHSAGRWSNTCCGHPFPGEPPEAGARRRLLDELGLELTEGDLEPGGVVTYRVSDPASRLVEREYNHLYVGRVAAAMRPDGAEVDRIETVQLADPEPARLASDGFTAWYGVVLAAAMPALLDLRVRTRTGSGGR